MNFRLVRILALFALLASALVSAPAAGAEAPSVTPDVALTGVTAVSSGSSHSCVINADKTVSCWGNNAFGQLGDGTTISRDLPKVVPGLANITQVAVGAAHTCALNTDGAVWCWGSSSNGQIGDDAKINRLSPVPVPALPFGVKAIAAGSAHTCAARSTDNSVRCWGLNDHGQLGDNTNTERQKPVFVSGMTGTVVNELVAGTSHTCALVSGGGVKCWGANSRGQIGNGQTADAKVPANAQISGVSDIAAGSGHNCAALSDGSVQCWGENESGQIGDTGALPFSTTPVVIPGIAGAVEVGAGTTSTCARLTSGGIVCLGDNQVGQLGDGTTNSRKTPAPVSGLSNATRLSVGALHACAIVSGGGLRCWGDNSSGQLADGSIIFRPVRADVSGLGDVKSLGGGIAHSCALLADGTVKCWGSNIYGQLGDGSKNGRSVPGTVPGLTGITRLAVGGGHTCALRGGDGVVFCWGYNNDGQLGDNTIVNKLSPVQVQNLSGALDVVAGYQHTCALTSTLGVQCWGANSSGQVGNGTTFSVSTPQDVVGLKVGVNAIAAGGYHTCAVTSSGAVKCWGRNDSGQLGNDSTTGSPVPADVVDVTGALAVTAGGAHSCAQLGDGTAKCWGANDKGQIGDGTFDQRKTPVAVSGLSGIVKLAASGPHTCAIVTGGKALCWGSAGLGELGTGNGSNTATPAEVQGALAGATSLGLGQSHTCVELGDKVVSCFGWDGSGQLGVGTVTRQLTPVSAQASMPPVLALNYSTGKPGSEFLLTGYRFPTTESVAFTINGAATGLNLPAAPGSLGSFVVDVTSNASDGAGIYKILAAAASANASASITLGAGAPVRSDPGKSAWTIQLGVAQPTTGRNVYLPIQMR